MLKKYWILTITLFAFFFYGCDISDSNKSTVTDELSEEELEIAGQIIAESLSDQKDGIFASLNDAFSLPTSNNMVEDSTQRGKYASSLFSTAMAKNGKNAPNNYDYDYNPDTGTHFVNFSRSINNKNLSKESTAQLEYIYFDADGNFIYSPRLDSDLIQTIEYNGTRSGSIVTPNKTSSYERNDQFLIDGVNSSSGILTIEGLHEGSGEFKVTRGNGDVIERNYTLTVELLDVQISDQSISSDGSLQKSVEGALAYEMTINKTLNGNESTKTVNGTIEFNGDGTALLRFQNILDNFKVTLEQGNLIADNEFKGFVQSVDTESEPVRFTLSDDQTYLFGMDTEIDSEGDLTTLSELHSILEAGIRVRAEGTFMENTDGAFIVQSVKFEYEDDDLEFEDAVESVDTEAGTFTLRDGTVFDITEETTFDEDGDLTSLEDVLWTLDQEFIVEAEGEFVIGEDGSNDVTNVKFEYDEDDFEFEDDVGSVDTENNSFTLENGDTYVINESTSFHDRTDLNTLEEVAAVLSGDGEVEAEGEYLPQSDGTKLVTRVKFETDDDDGDDDSDDNEVDETDFSGIVASADAAAETLTLESGLVLLTNEDTEFDDTIQSLGNLVGALEIGHKVSVEGEYYADSEGSNIALELEFDVDRQGNDDEDRDEFEFEGTVESADAAGQTFTIAGGLVFNVTTDTEFDGDLNSLGDLVAALERGDFVEVEGEYYTDSEARNIVIEAEFEAEGRDDDDEDDDGDDDEEDEREEFDFEGAVTSATSTTFMLNGQTFTVNEETEIEGDDGINTLQDVIDALNNGDEVEAEGEYYIDSDGNNIVIEAEFEVEHQDDDGDDDGDDEDEREESDFEGAVTSATSTTFTINGTTFTVDSDTEFDGDDGINTLQDVIDALNNGDEVEAEGEYYIDSDGDNIVIEVDFEVEHQDDDGDDDGDDEDDEEREESDFEGIVTSATSTTFTINGTTFTIDSDSEFDGDIDSMEELIDALNNGDEVEAEGEYYIEGGNNIVTEVEFEVE